MSGSISAVNPYVVALTSSTSFTALPIRDSMGDCTASPLRDGNSISMGKCRVFVTSSASIATNSMLDPSTFAASTGLTASSLKVFSTNSSSFTTIGTASSPLGSCTASGTTNICWTIKQIKLFFIKGTSTTLDYTSSYLVVSQTFFNNPTNIVI